MSFSFGFYNSKNHDRKYNALQISMIFDGIIRDGVYATIGKSFVVKSSPIDKQVIVQPGRAWFDHTWNYNDADLPITAPEAELILDRVDALVFDIDSSENNRLNQIMWVSGMPAIENPSRPTMVNEGTHHQYPLCYVYRKANTATINQEDITNMIGSSECPFVTGILETIDIDELLLQWKDQWAQFILLYEQSAEEWQEEQKENFKKFYDEFIAQMEAFEQASTQDFISWFDTIQDILDGDTAGHLLNLIQELDEREFLDHYGLINSTTIIDSATKNITESSSTMIATTKFQNTDTGKVITTTLVPNDGYFDYVSTTTIVNTDEGKKITTSYLKRAK